MNFEDILNVVTDWLTGSGLRIIFIIVGAFIANWVVRVVIKRGIKKLVVSKSDESQIAEERRENTLIKIFNGTFSVVLFIAVVLMLLSEAGLNIGPLIAGAGVVGIAVGFGGQYLIKDLITGFFIILENQLRVGDVVEITGISGVVENITLRKVVLRDVEGVVHHVPNGEITTVSNKTRIFSKINLSIGIGYESDLAHVEKLVNQIGEEVAEEFSAKVRIAPNYLRVDELGDSAVIIKIVGETTPGDQWEIAGEMRKRILEKFREEGIDLPYPQRVITQKN